MLFFKKEPVPAPLFRVGDRVIIYEWRIRCAGVIREVHSNRPIDSYWWYIVDASSCTHNHTTVWNETSLTPTLSQEIINAFR